MATTALSVMTKFNAGGNFTSAVKKMTAASMSFGQKTAASFAMVERQERRLRKSVGGLLGKFGQLGVGLGGLALLTQVATANIELDKNMASLSAITGVTGEAFNGFKKEIEAVSFAQKKFAGDTAKAFEVVGSAKPELLANATALSAVTNAAITLSKATGDELATSADDLTGSLNQFNLAADQSNRVINALAAGSQAGAAAVPLITESLRQFGTIANSINVPIEASIGLIETLAEKNLKGAEAGNKLRNVLTNMAAVKALPPKALTQLSKFGVNLDIVSDKTLPIQARLKELSKIGDDATALFKVFGKENLIAGQILLQNVDKVEKYTKAVTGTSIASEQAAINSNTIADRLTEVQAAFKNATTSTNTNNFALSALKNILVVLADNMGAIIGVVGTLVGAFVAFKAIMFLSKAAMIGYNVVLGINAALTGQSAFAVSANAIAYTAFRGAVIAASVATKIFTGVSAALNFVLSLNPIGLIISGIIALVAVTALIIKKWDSWGAALSVLLGPFGMIISLIQSFRRNWDLVKDAFSTGGILGGLKAIGAVILDSLIMPIQQLLEMIAKIPGVGKYAASAVDSIKSFREGLGVNVTTNESGEPLAPLNAEASSAKVTSEQIKTNNTKNELIIKDETGRAELVKSEGNIPISLSTTIGG